MLLAIVWSYLVYLKLIVFVRLNGGHGAAVFLRFFLVIMQLIFAFRLLAIDEAVRCAVAQSGKRCPERKPTSVRRRCHQDGWIVIEPPGSQFESQE